MFVEKLNYFMETAKQHLFEVGDIVALNSHPYTTSQHKVLISGEPQLISPLMVIIEIIRDLQDLHDEFTGVNIQIKGKTFNCKCIWYSSKSAQFEEAWLSSKLLKLIRKKGETVSKSQAIGTTVTLSTAQMELSKVKSSLKTEGEKQSTSLNPLLSFVSPLMQIIGTPKSEKKEPLYDIKTGKQKKEISQQMVKCKWFNPSSDKMSETLIPIEALYLIPIIREEMLNEYSKYIKEQQHISITLEGKAKDYQTIFLPQKIKYLHGEYLIIGYDYIKNKAREFKILKLSSTKLDSPFVTQAPNFKDNELKVLSLTEQVKRLIAEGLQDKKYLRIRYKDRYDNLTLRTLKKYLTNFNEKPKQTLKQKLSETAKTPNSMKGLPDYLSGFCELRKAERHFQIDRILSIEILNISYE
jgi:hypothetical protein